MTTIQINDSDQLAYLRNLIRRGYSNDSDQPACLRSLIRVFAGHSIGRQIPNITLCGQRRLWLRWSESSLGVKLIWTTTWQNKDNDMCAQRRLRSAWATAQSDHNLRCAWRNLVSLATHWAHSEDSDQAGRMPRLIWVFAGRTCHFVGFVTRWLIL